MTEFADEQVRRSSQPLVVGAAHDPAEHEADAIADETVRRLADQETEAGAPAHVHPVPAGRLQRSAHAAHDEFEAPPEIEQRIRRATGSGQPLDAAVRRRFEGATGRDLGNVRIHRGAEADQLNTAVSAKAFTTGNDIFFSKGSFQPGSPQGQHLLAHELAHTAQHSGSVQRTIRRFALDRPDFDATVSVTVKTGGASGNVAEFDDGSGTPLIVKVHQQIGNEVAVAGSLHGATTARNKGAGGFSVSTPGVRLATDQEKAAIKKATLAKRDPAADPRNFVAHLDSQLPTVLMLKGAGQTLDKVIQGESFTTQDESGATVGNSASLAFQVLSEPGPLTTLGQQLPTDVLMGMFDRMLGLYNPENFLYDSSSKAFSFVDNTQNRSEGYLTALGGGGNLQKNFEVWAGNARVTELAKNRKALADEMYRTVFGPSGMILDVPAKDQRSFKATCDDQATQLKKWILQGIEKGKKSLMAELDKPLRHVGSIPDHASKVEAVQSLIARRHVLKGMAADKAWAKGGAEAAKLVPAPTTPKSAPQTGQQAPQRPATQAPNQAPTASSGSTWKSASPRGAWKSAQPSGR